MKIGTLVKNHWAGDKNPARIFIYTGTGAEYSTGLALVEGKLEKVSFYKRDFKKQDKFEPVGYTKGFDILKEDLKKELEVE